MPWINIQMPNPPTTKLINWTDQESRLNEFNALNCDESEWRKIPAPMIMIAIPNKISPISKLIDVARPTIGNNARDAKIAWCENLPYCRDVLNVLPKITWWLFELGLCSDMFTFPSPQYKNSKCRSRDSSVLLSAALLISWGILRYFLKIILNLGVYECVFILN